MRTRNDWTSRDTMRIWISRDAVVEVPSSKGVVEQPLATRGCRAQGAKGFVFAEAKIWIHKYIYFFSNQHIVNSVQSKLP
jgi:hypothetical protein